MTIASDAMPSSTAHAGARLGIRVKWAQRDAVRDDAKPPLRDPLLDPRDVRRLGRNGDDGVQGPDQRARGPQRAATVDVRAVLGMDPTPDTREQRRRHGMEHGGGIVRVHDIRPRRVQELSEAGDQRRVRAICADHVVNGDPVATRRGGPRRETASR